MDIAYQTATEIPERLKPGVIYHSPAYKMAIHLCACGCGAETVTPLGSTGWMLSLNNGRVDLHPSVSNQQLGCASHYVIRGGRVQWLDRVP